MRRILSLLLLLASPMALAETVAQPEVATRLINLPTHLGPGPSTLEVTFTHRFLQTVSDAGGADLFGLDSAANVGIGLGLGLGHGLSAEVYRSSFFKEWEGSVKWTAARQSGAFPLGIAVRAGGDYRGAARLHDRWSGFVQAVLTRRVGTHLDFFVVPMFATDTPTLTNAANLGVGASLHLVRGWDLSAEAIPGNRDGPHAELAWSAAVTKRVPGHAFLIYLGNSPATTVDLLVGSDYPAGFKSGDIRLGFNLIRRF